jgi:hypothetical protein
MKLGRVLVSSTIGTVALTVFSTWRSVQEGHEYRESVLLEGFCNKKGKMPKSAGWLGWSLHTAIGLGLTTIYHHRWTKTANLVKGALAGTTTVPFAWVVWASAFNLHPNPPKTYRQGFYRQVALANIIFGATVGLLHKK